MKNRRVVTWTFSLLLFAGLLTGCDQNKLGTQPDIPDLNSVGCLITNDFYAVHLSVYVKTSTAKQDSTDRAALLKPYCQELPDTGKAFFAADLIDRDIRKTPIGIRVVELELIGTDDSKPEDFKEVRTLTEVAPKMYTKGVVEAQADIDKNGYYAMYLLIGGDEAISDEDKMRIPFHVGGDPDALPKKTVMLIAGGVVTLIVFIIAGLVWYRKKQQSI
ncbi:hypothetical protein [Methylobacter psychrophilus]|jgi:hypothetical protein|uniref:hypothetical protein n=1 Tax=Methylobacter psychrophilus TaxID=96941 RepID=UPI0021D48A19|nr:hypothetical protein [Methylobacter psychrophilus]